jgi:hypothetical protein
MNLPGREAKVARRISDPSEQYIEEQKKPSFPQGPDQFREAMRVAKEGCCKGRPEKAGLSIWDNELWARKLLRVEYERRYCPLRVNGIGLYLAIHRIPRSTVSLLSTYCIP